jgi:hypothetical protein
MGKNDYIQSPVIKRHVAAKTRENFIIRPPINKHIQIGRSPDIGTIALADVAEN